MKPHLPRAKAKKSSPASPKHLAVPRPAAATQQSSAPARRGIRILTPEEEKNLPTAEGFTMGSGESEKERVLREVDEMLLRGLSR